MLFAMIKYYFSSITRHGFQRICEVFVRKDFSRFFDVLRARDDRITCAVQRRQWPCVNRLALHNPLEVSKKSLRGTLNFLREIQNVFRDTNNFLRETQYVFPDTTNFLRETQYVFDGDTTNVFRDPNIFLRETQDVFRDTTILVDGVKCSHAYLTKTAPSYEYMITSCDAINSDECVSHVDMFCKCKQKDSRCRLHSQKSGCSIRDREPSRVSLRKVIRKLKCR